MLIKNKWFIGILLFLLADGILCLYVFGRSLWHPVYIKISGGQSTAEVVAAVQKSRPGALPKDITTFEALTLIGLKEERTLEVWGHQAGQPPRWIATYPFTGYSGKLGPKLREGDRQIPEGLYQIEYLNPNSSYHLSMKVNYPNAFDRQKGESDGREQLGYDIFIHGKSATIGCIPIGDPAIEELFAMVAKIGPNHTRVILAPYDMRVHDRKLVIPDVEWEQELYQLIDEALEVFVRK
ncbi:MAG: L,D-transpeptidase family protein [Verrucomicrobiota bacterium]